LGKDTIELLEEDAGNDLNTEIRVWATQLCTILEDRVVGSRGSSGRYWDRNTLAEFVDRAVKSPEAWGELPGDTLVTWPLDSTCMGRLLLSLAKQPKSIKKPRKVEIITPCRCAEGCDSVELITDLWSSPWMSKEAWIKQVRITETQREFVPPGEGPARSGRKCLAVLRMDPLGEEKANRMIMEESEEDNEWMGENTFRYRTGIGVLIEVNQGQVLKVRRELAAGVLRKLEGGFHPEELVPGLKKEEGRAIIKLSTKEGKFSELDLEALVRKVKDHFGQKELWVALDTIFKDTGAMVVETNHPKAFEKIWHLCEEATSINKNMVLVRSSADKERWEQEVERLFQEDRRCCITKVRYRRSVGGTVWVQPLATTAQMAALKVAENGEAGKEEAERTIHGGLSGGAGHLTEDILNDIIGKMGEAGIKLDRTVEGEPMGEGQWKPHLTSSCGDITGGFSMTLSNKEEAEKAATLLRSINIRVNQKLIKVVAKRVEEEAERAKNCLALRTAASSPGGK